MKILIVTKNSVIGEGIALELCDLGYNARYSPVLTEDCDLYITDLDSCEFEKKENHITFSVFDKKADLKRPFSTDELIALIGKKCDTADLPLKGAKITEEEFDTSDLSETEAKLLSVLLENRGNPVSTEELLRRVWSRDNSQSNIVNVYIRYLRQKLEKGSANRIIFTVRGQGYKIN